MLLNEGVVETTAIEYLKKLVQEGPYRGQVYLAGGAVRDMEMGGSPKDLDVVVTNHDITGGMEFARWATLFMKNYKGPTEVVFKEFIQFIKTNWDLICNKDEATLQKLAEYTKNMSNPVLFPTFGTAKFVLKGVEYNGIDLSNMDIECVAARKEEYIHGSRKPIVRAGTIEDDIYRRDYTINSLVFDLTTSKVLDITGRGISDIHNGILKTTSPADEIYQQDSLRILRGVRFAIKYGFTLDEETLEGMKRNINELQHISKERIRDEMNKMLLTDHPAEALDMLKDIGAMKYISPELEQAIGMGQNKYHKHDVWMHSLEVLKKTKPNLINRLMALFHDVGKVKTKTIVDGEIHFYEHEHIGADMAREILTNLKYPSEIINPVVAGIKNHMRLKRSGEKGELVTDKALRKFVVDLGDHLEATLDVMSADNASHEGSHTNPEQIPNIIRRIDALKNSIPKKTDKLPVTGDDLISLKIPRGPIYKEILDAIRDAIYENPNLTRDEAFNIVRNIIKNK